jgi:hypothetical protein
MGVRAVIAVSDGSGRRSRFRSAWASKQYQIPHLARFVHTADHNDLPLTVEGYVAYTATQPDTLPAEDITDHGRYADPNQVGDLDHRYELHLRQRERTFRYVVYDRDREPSRPPWRRVEDLATRAQLYQAAVRMCRRLAATTQRHADRNDGGVPPGWPSPQDWCDEAERFTAWLADTDPELLHRAGPTVAAVPAWFAVRTARAQSHRLRTRLREQYPDVQIRTRIGGDGVVTLTVPVHLSTDAAAARIAALVGDLLGRSFTLSVRPHRRSRHSSRTGQATHAPVNATLTLHPHDTAAAAPHPDHDAERGQAGQ